MKKKLDFSFFFYPSVYSYQKIYIPEKQEDFEKVLHKKVDEYINLNPGKNKASGPPMFPICTVLIFSVV